MEVQSLKIQIAEMSCSRPPAWSGVWGTVDPWCGDQGPLICVQQSGLAASGSGAEQRPDNWPAPAPCPQCPHSAAHLLTLHLRPSTPHHHTKPSVTVPGDGPCLQSRIYEDTRRFICRYLTIRCSCSYLVAVLC